MRLKRPPLFISTLLCTTLLLSACTTAIQSVTPEVPTPVTGTAEETATAQPEEEATPAPTGEATEEPAEEATAVPTEEPTGEGESAGAADSDIGEIVRQTLVQELQVEADAIEIVSVEAVEWPDACLGVYNADEMCAQVITPGYRVILEAEGRTFEYHTDADGMSIRLAEGPEASIQDPLILFETQVNGCTTAQIGTTGVAFGPCGSAQVMSQLIVPERGDQLAELVATFAPFIAMTDAGTVDFYGRGDAEPTPAQQRMIAEWARTVVLEAQSGRADATWGLAFTWHREGGIAGFCDDVTAYVTGQLHVTSCRGQEPETIEARWLSADELEQIYAWMDHFAPFEFVQSDDAKADSMTVHLVFAATGTTLPDAAEQQAILDYASNLFLQATQ